jgi:hypothetical protein
MLNMAGNRVFGFVHQRSRQPPTSRLIAFRKLAQSSAISEDDKGQNNKIFSRVRPEKHEAAPFDGMAAQAQRV